VLFSSRVGVRVRIRFSVWLVNGYSHVFILLTVVIVTLTVSEHHYSTKFYCLVTEACVRERLVPDRTRQRSR